MMVVILKGPKSASKLQRTVLKDTAKSATQVRHPFLPISSYNEHFCPRFNSTETPSSPSVHAVHGPHHLQSYGRISCLMN